MRWSAYGFGALVVGAALMVGAVALPSWPLAIASVAMVALGVVVLRLRDVEPVARDERFAEIMTSPAVMVIGVLALIALWVLAIRNGGGPLIVAVMLTVSAGWRAVQRLRSAS